MMELYLRSAESQACNVCNRARQEVPFEESRPHRVTRKVEEDVGGRELNFWDKPFANPKTLWLMHIALKHVYDFFS